MFITVNTVVKGQGNLFTLKQADLRIEFIKGLRPWHRKPEHQNIEGDLLRVNMEDQLLGNVWFVVINESEDSFRDRLREIKSK